MISASTRRLSVFKSVVDSGGFNSAAMRLGIAQPSVGAHIKALESQVGQPLFLRHRGNRPQLTKAGEAVYAYAVDVLQKSETTSHALAELRSTMSRQIVLAVHRDVAPHFLPIRLAAFAEKYPKVSVTTRIGTIDDVIGLVRARAVDLGFFLTLGPTRGMRSEVLGCERLALVVSPQHPLAGDKSLSAGKLERYQFVTGLHGSHFNHLADMALKKIGLLSYKIAMEVQESTAAKEFVRHGVNIACLPRCTVVKELSARTLVELKPGTPLQDLELRCGYPGPLSDNATRFLACLKSANGN